MREAGAGGRRAGGEKPARAKDVGRSEADRMGVAVVGAGRAGQARRRANGGPGAQTGEAVEAREAKTGRRDAAAG